MGVVVSVSQLEDEGDAKSIGIVRATADGTLVLCDFQWCWSEI